MKEVGVQGLPGSYTGQAARLLRPEADLTHFQTFPEVFEALHERRVGSIVVAIANNRIGFIPEVYEEITGMDRPVTAPNPYAITGEAYIRVEHALLGLPGARLEEIDEVNSQAPAIAQCRHFLDTYLPNVDIEERHDTAGSAQLVAELGDPSKAAIASIDAGELYGLEVIRAKIQNDRDNVTRFVRLQIKDDVDESDDNNKTTLILHTPEGFGALDRILRPFTRARISHKTLQSTPIPNSAFECSFFIEFNAGTQEKRVKKILSNIDKRRRYRGYEVEVIGSYVAAEIPISSNGAER